MKRKILSVVLTLAMVLSLLPTAVFAVEYSDTTGHWAASAIDRWSNYGVVQGTDNGFQPDASMTRAQAATVFSNLLGLKASTGTQSWADADPNAWYMGALRSANDAGIMNGVGDGRMNPNGEVTREQFFTMFARAIGLKPQETTSGVAADGSDWSKGYINALTDKGFVKGDGTSVNALADINRASVMTLLDQTITTYANEPGATVEGTGEGVVLVAADGVTVTGNVDTLVVAEAASGDNGVKVENATVGQLSVTGEAEVALAGATKVDAVVVAEAAEGASLAVAAGAQVTSVEVAAPKASIENSGVIASVQVTETATNAEVKAEAGSYTGVIATEAKTTSVSGAGAVANVVASGDAAATGNNGVQVTTSGTKTATVDAMGEAKTATTSGTLPAASGSNAAAATTAASEAAKTASEAIAAAETAAKGEAAQQPATQPQQQQQTTTGGGGGSTTYYYVTYNVNAPAGAKTDDVSGSVSSASSSSSTREVQVAANGFTVTGYTFIGWNDKKDGTGHDFLPGATVEFTGDVTLYAQWTKTDIMPRTVWSAAKDAPLVDIYKVGDYAIKATENANAGITIADDTDAAVTVVDVSIAPRVVNGHVTGSDLLPYHKNGGDSMGYWLGLAVPVSEESNAYMQGYGAVEDNATITFSGANGLDNWIWNNSATAATNEEARVADKAETHAAAYWDIASKGESKSHGTSDGENGYIVVKTGDEAYSVYRFNFAGVDPESNVTIDWEYKATMTITDAKVRTGLNYNNEKFGVVSYNGESTIKVGPEAGYVLTGVTYKVGDGAAQNATKNENDGEFTITLAANNPADKVEITATTVAEADLIHTGSPSDAGVGSKKLEKVWKNDPGFGKDRYDKNYTVTAGDFEDPRSFDEPVDDDGYIPVTVTMEGLKAHMRGDGKLGYWAGVFIEQPTVDAVKVKIGRSTESMELAKVATLGGDPADVDTNLIPRGADYAVRKGVAVQTVADDESNIRMKGVALYPDAKEYKGTGLYVFVKWLKSDGNTVVGTTSYKLDFSGVSFDDVGVTMDLRPNADTALTVTDEFAYNDAYDAAGITFETTASGGDLKINPTAFDDYVNGDEFDAAAEAALVKAVGDDNYFWVGVQFAMQNTGCSFADTAKISRDNGSTWEEVSLNSKSNGVTFVYNYTWIDYINVAKQTNKTGDWLVSQNPATRSYIFQWLKGGAVVGYSQLSYTRSLDNNDQLPQ